MATREELYAKFGIAAEAGQLFETDLGTFLLGLEGLANDWQRTSDKSAATEFYAKMNRKTLGQLYRSVKDHVHFDESIAEKLEAGLRARNLLNHGFYLRHDFSIQTDEGRDRMLEDLEQLHIQLFDAWQVAQKLAEAFTDVLSSTRST